MYIIIYAVVLYLSSYLLLFWLWLFCRIARPVKCSCDPATIEHQRQRWQDQRGEPQTIEWEFWRSCRLGMVNLLVLSHVPFYVMSLSVIWNNMVAVTFSEAENSSKWQDYGRWQYTPCWFCNEWCIDIGASAVQIGSTARLIMLESCNLQIEELVAWTFTS